MTPGANRFLISCVIVAGLGGCTLFGVDVDSTTTEVKQDSALQGQVRSLESRILSLERKIDRIESRLGR